jgi:hypothetical protein
MIQQSNPADPHGLGKGRPLARSADSGMEKRSLTMHGTEH